MAGGQSLEIPFVMGGGLRSCFLALWKNFADVFELELFAPGGQQSGRIISTEPFRRVNLGQVDTAIYYGQPSFYSENQEVFFLLNAKGQNKVTQGIWRLRVTGVRVTDGEFHIWLPTLEEVGADTHFTRPDPEITLTLPSTAGKVISVGGYNSRIGAAADFSGRGYTFRNIYVKPDIVAPAVNILTTRPGGGYDSFSGTSLAAPFVTGAAALMMEWGMVLGNDRFLYGQRVKAFLHKSAARDAGISYPNPVWGYGALCLKTAMDALVEYT
jgi:hypothetical protein